MNAAESEASEASQPATARLDADWDDPRSLDNRITQLETTVRDLPANHAERLAKTEATIDLLRWLVAVGVPAAAILLSGTAVVVVTLVVDILGVTD
ncbi:hypothetical protein [Candidatus Poriferisodalis multihospitum]|uniref:hypothetical protein n=1 Tax=Candidatus Poriferisodalis multihospitum TaxID=2983191 RepID=UPI002B25B0F4|nr:hypothetical protein [Candidatus Poriferisodalis multihospitum]